MLPPCFRDIGVRRRWTPVITGIWSVTYSTTYLKRRVYGYYWTPKGLNSRAVGWHGLCRRLITNLSRLPEEPIFLLLEFPSLQEGLSIVHCQIRLVAALAGAAWIGGSYCCLLRPRSFILVVVLFSVPLLLLLLLVLVLVLSPCHSSVLV